MKSKIIYLTGLSGSGKSQTGAALAKILKCDCIDLDNAIESAAGTSIAEIFETQGEHAFRHMECETVSQLVKKFTETQLVVSLGGGALTNDATFKLVRESGILVYLQVSCSEAANRLMYTTDRPLLRNEDREQLTVSSLTQRLREMLNDREERYKSADLHVRVTGVTPQAAARMVADKLKSVVSRS